MMLLLGVARSQTLKEMVAALGGGKQTSYVQYRLNRLEDLGYLKSIAGKSRSRFLTDKGKAMIGQYHPKINDWRIEEAETQNANSGGMAGNI